MGLSATSLGKSGRVHTRVRPAVQRPVSVQIVGAGFIEQLQATDVSVGGLGVYVRHLFEGCNTDEQVEVVLTLPWEKPFLLHALIRHVTRKGMEGHFGIQFVDISAADLKRVEAYVARRVADGATL